MTERDERPIRWGILATGKIAESFATDLALLDDHTLAAVGSRRQEAADEFGGRHGAARMYGSYEGVIDDPDVDVVYIATPHSRHLDDVIACFEAGKPVLCEKPLTLHGDHALYLADEARKRNLFLAEAMWMRANPAIRTAVELAASGAIGDIGSVRADLGFVAPTDKARLWDPELGASALLDVGVYPVTLAHLFLGSPDALAATTIRSDLDVDLAGGATFTYASGGVASLSWGQMSQSDNRASIGGTDGIIEIPARFHHPDFLTIRRGDATEHVDVPRLGKGMTHEIIEVGECLRAGRTESDVLSLDGTVDVMRTLDRIQDHWRSTTSE